MPLSSTTLRSRAAAPTPIGSRRPKLATIGHAPSSVSLEVAGQRSAVERCRSTKTLGRHHQCELTAHAEPDDADRAGALRHRLHVIAGGEDVVEGAAPLGEQLAEDPGDAASAAAARVHVRRDRDESRRGDPRRRRLVVRAVPDRVVHHDHARPGALAVGHAEQCIDRAVRGVDPDRRHVRQSTEPSRYSGRSPYMAMRLFLLYVVVELAVIVALASTIGFGWTVLAAARDLRGRPRAGRLAGQASHPPAAVRPDRRHGAGRGGRQRARRARHRARRRSPVWPAPSSVRCCCCRRPARPHVRW